MFLTYGYFLVPLLIIIYGVMHYNDEPKIDAMVGYRTKRSLKNQETFTFSNKLLSEYFIRFNCISLLITVLYCLLYNLFKNSLPMGLHVLVFLSLSTIQISCCLLPFFLVERKLKKMIKAQKIERELRMEREYISDDNEYSSIDIFEVENRRFFYGNEDIL